MTQHVTACACSSNLLLLINDTVGCGCKLLDYEGVHRA